MHNAHSISGGPKKNRTVFKLLYFWGALSSMSEILYTAWAIWFVEVSQVSCGSVSRLWCNSAKSHGTRWLKKQHWAGYRSAQQRGAVGLQRCSTPRRCGRCRSLISNNNNSSESFVLPYLIIQEYCQWDHCFVSKMCRYVFFHEEKHFLYFLIAEPMVSCTSHRTIISFSSRSVNFLKITILGFNKGGLR